MNPSAGTSWERPTQPPSSGLGGNGTNKRVICESRHRVKSVWHDERRQLVVGYRELREKKESTKKE